MMERRNILLSLACGLLTGPLACNAEPLLVHRFLLHCLLITTIPLSVFLVHVTFFGSWIVDDAGISFAYARNLAAGHGLVSQPSAVRVEGHSNFLWVLLMSALIRLGLFHVVWTPKVVACILNAGVFLMVVIALARDRFVGWPVVAAGALTLVALQPSFVIWSISGLENPLYVFLLCLLMLGIQHLLTESNPSWSAAAFIGIAAAGVAATRPDGMVYLALAPLVFSVRAWRSQGPRPWLSGVVAYGTVSLALVAALFGFRWLYFRDLVPNTYYSKGGSSLESLGSVVALLPDTMLKMRDLAAAIAGQRGAMWLLILVFGGTILLISGGRFRPLLATFLLLSAFSGVVYLLLPSDWMGEYRFASPFFLFFYVYIVTLAWFVCATTMRTTIAKRMFVVVLTVLVAGTGLHVTRRSVAFAEKPTVPLSVVAEHYGERFNRVAATLGLKAGSLLVSDMGGTLLYSKLAVFDLAGLCDRTIARTIGRDQRAFYEYVFAQVRPTFIHVHPPLAAIADFDRDERFRRDYVPIRERIVYEGSTKRLESGDFIRREVLSGPLEPLAAILSGDVTRSLDSAGGLSCCGWIK